MHPRVHAVLGGQCLEQLSSMDVLLVGMRGLGAETAKCLLQCGVHSLTVHDDDLVQPADVRTNFLLRSSDVRTPRAEAVLPRLRALAGERSQVARLRGTLQTQRLGGGAFHVVVVTEAPLETLIVLNEFCRSQDPPIGFVAAESRGVAGYLFSDFGPEYAVLDRTGVPVPDALVNKIHFRRDGEARIITCEPHAFQDGDTVLLREVRGCDGLNGVPLLVHGCDRLSFSVSNCQGLPKYRGGGVVSRAEVPEVLHHDSLRNCCVKPLPRDGPVGGCADKRSDRAQQLHVAFRGLQAFRSRYQHFPLCASEDHACEVERLARQFVDRNQRVTVAEALQLDGGGLDASLVRCVARCAGAEFLPLSMALAGFVAQEVVKYTGRGTPCDQWLYVDVVEALADPDQPLPPSERPTEEADVEDPLPYLFGLSFTRRLRALKALVIGSGGVGSEVIKGLATMGVCTAADEGGLCSVADDAVVNSGDLLLGSLCGPANLGQPRAACVVAGARSVNEALQAQALDTYGDAPVDVVVAAVNTRQQRDRVDRHCVFFRQAWVDTGVEGTMGHAQVILPDQTECYGDSADQRPPSVPSCTIRNFPYRPAHVAQWAAEQFRFCFAEVGRECLAVARHPGNWADAFAQRPGDSASKRRLLELVTGVLDAACSNSFAKCGQLARQLFEHQFANRIKLLLLALPLDHAVDGVPFWLGPRRPPQPLHFDRDDPLHASFALSAALLFAQVAGVRAPADADALEPSALRFIPAAAAPFKPKPGAVFQVHEADDRPERARDDERAIAGLLKEVSTADVQLLSESTLRELQFAQDDNAAAAAFCSSAALLRAQNYGIQGVSRSECELVGSNTLPALGTTTTTVAGLALLEMCKTVQQKPVNEFRNSFVNLALPLWVPCEPRPPRQTRSMDVNPATGGPLRAVPENFTVWDKEVVRDPRGRLTVEQLLGVFLSRYEVRTTMVAAEGMTLYASWNAAHAARLRRDLVEVYEEVSGLPFGADRSYLVLQLACEDDEGDVTIPMVQYYVPAQ